MNDDVYVWFFSFFNGFQKWSKLPKYLWNTAQTSLCIHRQLRTTKLPMNDDAYVYFFLFLMIFKREKTTKIHLKNRQTSTNKYKVSKTTKVPMNDDIYV